MEPVSSNEHVLSWWKRNEKQLLLLAPIAKQVLCTSATSTPSERSFSKAGNLISVKRALLKPPKVDMILFLNKDYFQFKH